MLYQRHQFKNGQLRLRGWNYSWDGCYFITIKTTNRTPFFGEIKEGKMVLNEAGKRAHKLWESIPKQFNFIQLGEFVVMPDHIHGILILEHCGVAIHRDQIENTTQTDNPDKELTKENKGGITGLHNPMLQDSISKVMRWYKAKCSYDVRKTGIPLEWQSRFYDHVIRNQRAFDRISQYIIDNPGNWKKKEQE